MALRYAWRNFRRNLESRLAGCLALTLALAAGFAGIYGYRNLTEITRLLGHNVKINVYLNDGADPPAAVRDLQALTQNENLPAQIVFLTPEDALAHFARQMGSDATLLEEVGGSPLPATIELHLAPGAVDVQRMDRLATTIRRFPWAEGVQYGRRWIVRLTHALATAEWAGGLVLGFLAVCVAFVAGSIIRLTLHAQRDEIAVQRIAGATDDFIIRPFVFEGALLGATAGTLAIAGLGLLHQYYAGAISESIGFFVPGGSLRFFGVLAVPGLVLAAGSLGFAGSYVAVRRYLHA